MKYDSHSPRVREDGHGTEVDIWGVGHLLTSAKDLIGEYPKQLIDLGHRIKLGSGNLDLAVLSGMISEVSKGLSLDESMDSQEP